LLSRPEYADPDALGGIAQIAILGYERYAEPHGQLQVNDTTRRQPLAWLAGASAPPGDP
jgi:hypothetical protein